MDSKQEASDLCPGYTETPDEMRVPSRRWAIVGTAAVLASFVALYVMGLVAWVFMMVLAPETFPVIRSLVSLIPGVIFMVVMLALIRPVLKGKCLGGVFAVMLFMSVGSIPVFIIMIGRMPPAGLAAFVVLVAMASVGAFFAFNAWKGVKEAQRDV